MARVAVAAEQFRAEAILPVTITITSAITYSGSMALDIYRPGSLTGRPGLVLVHGGGWTQGSSTDESVVDTARLFCELGFVVACINYRLAPGGNRTPNYRQPMIDDIRSAIQWLRTNAATYGADSTRVACLGMSAGGHLAFMAACQGATGADRPDAAVGWSPPTRLESMVGDGLLYTRDYVGVSDETDPEFDTVSPYYQVTSAVCPLRIVGSANEPTSPGNGGIAVNQYDDMHTVALAAGVDSTKRIIPGAIHADFRGIDLLGSASWLQTKLQWARASTRTSAGTREVATGRIAA